MYIPFYHNINICPVLLIFTFIFISHQQVITQITGCKVLSCPDRCPPDMYRIMVSCWRQNPQERPSMATLYAQICSLITVEPHVLDYD